MNKSTKSMFGATLLEIMLVLAVAAMIIVMSVRYYQSANQGQQSNAFVEQIQGITATVESVAQSGGGYTAATLAAITPLLPASAFTAPWGGALQYAPSSTGYVVTLSPAPSTAVCSLVQARLQSDTHYTIPAGCATVTYVGAGS